MSFKKILVVDFDGVLHSYSSGWQGATKIPDQPVEGAIQFLKKAVEEFQVMIYSSRSKEPGGILAMQEWLGKYCSSWEPEYTPNPWWGLIDWPTEKPAAWVTLDDRAICFTGEFPSMETLLEFKPWNKR
jgi:hypothetical protein